MDLPSFYAHINAKITTYVRDAKALRVFSVHCSTHAIDLPPQMCYNHQLHIPNTIVSNQRTHFNSLKMKYGSGIMHRKFTCLP